jgi:hypothetical protein
MDKVTEEVVSQLNKGKEVIEEYLKDPQKEFIPRVIESLIEVGFKGFEDFYYIYEDASYAEINACYKVVHRVTGEENPFCDNCEGMKAPEGTTEHRGCMRTSGKDSSAGADMFTNRADGSCYTQRVSGGIPVGEKVDRKLAVRLAADTGLLKDIEL